MHANPLRQSGNTAVTSKQVSARDMSIRFLEAQPALQLKCPLQLQKLLRPISAHCDSRHATAAYGVIPAFSRNVSDATDLATAVGLVSELPRRRGRAARISIEIPCAAGAIRRLRTARTIAAWKIFPETVMKAYRLITLVAAVLITALLARFLTNEDVGQLQDQAHVESAATP